MTEPDPEIGQWQWYWKKKGGKQKIQPLTPLSKTGGLRGELMSQTALTGRAWALVNGHPCAGGGGHKGKSALLQGTAPMRISSIFRRWAGGESHCKWDSRHLGSGKKQPLNLCRCWGTGSKASAPPASHLTWTRPMMRHLYPVLGIALEFWRYPVTADHTSPWPEAPIHFSL